MGKFEKGQWVRVTDNAGAPRFYSVGEVCQVESIDGTVRCVGKAGGMYPYRFEAWQPKVGDRVRFTDAVPSHWFFGPATQHKEGVIRSDSEESGGLRFTVNVGNSYGYVNLEHIEPAPVTAPAPLTITAGGYYKTRDGRKVGPAFIGGDVATFGTSDNWSSAVWANDGRQSSRQDKKTELANDIIAEWVDEPAPKPAAIANDNAAPAKFKVGDRVKFRPGYPSSAAGREATVVAINAFGIQVDMGVRGGVSTESESDLVPATTPAIVALIESGKPKPATRPVVHASKEEATTEASRLALAHPGQEFGVFVLAESKIADEVVTKTAVLRAA